MPHRSSPGRMGRGEIDFTVCFWHMCLQFADSVARSGGVRWKVLMSFPCCGAACPAAALLLPRCEAGRLASRMQGCTSPRLTYTPCLPVLMSLLRRAWGTDPAVARAPRFCWLNTTLFCLRPVPSRPLRGIDYHSVHFITHQSLAVY